MAFSFLGSNHIYTSLHFRSTRTALVRAVQREDSPSLVNFSAVPAETGDGKILRRQGNYQPCIWEFDYVQSISSDYKGEMCERRGENLKREVKRIIEETAKPLEKLELVDLLQRLGVSYHFEDEIKRLMESVFVHYIRNDKIKQEDLYATSLAFRLLRQHGYHVTSEIFGDLIENGKFKASLCEDTKAILALYEATYLSVRDEIILDEARDFAISHLKESLEQNIDHLLALQVIHALELPLHWRVQRSETRWFIGIYERQPDMNNLLLEFAKLYFNMVQAVHQEDLKDMSRWWASTGLGEKLSFARDRLMENFLWTVEGTFEPEMGYCRKMITKLNAFITLIDDIYDVYGTLDELELFTNVVERWNLDGVDQLPDYLKICFVGLYNTINEMAYDALKEHGFFLLSYMKKEWAELCQAYLVEAKWYHSGYTPTLREYLDNAWISISAPLTLAYAYFFIEKNVTKEALECLEKYPSIIHCSAMILRLSNDLGTSSNEIKKGDTPKSVQCYMRETGVSEEKAWEHVKHLIGETWKKINQDRVADSPLPQTLISTAMNLARMAQCIYQYGDGYGIQDRETKDLVLSLLINPIPI